MSRERSIEDRLAEALFLDSTAGWEYSWNALPDERRFDFFYEAKKLLAALPSVGLTLTRNDGGEG